MLKLGLGSIGMRRTSGFFAGRESPSVSPDMATSFHLLAQIKGGKAKCPTPAIRPSWHGWKENAVDGVYSRLHQRVGHPATLAKKREMRAARVLLCQCSAMADAVLAPKMLVINRILFSAMQLGQMVWRSGTLLCLLSFVPANERRSAAGRNPAGSRPER